MNTELFRAVNDNHDRIQRKRIAKLRRQKELPGDIAFLVLPIIAVLLTGLVEAL